jgi:hypothetical protein
MPDHTPSRGDRTPAYEDGSKTPSHDVWLPQTPRHTPHTPRSPAATSPREREHDVEKEIDEVAGNPPTPSANPTTPGGITTPNDAAPPTPRTPATPVERHPSYGDEDDLVSPQPSPVPDRLDPATPVNPTTPVATPLDLPQTPITPMENPLTPRDVPITPQMPGESTDIVKKETKKPVKQEQPDEEEEEEEKEEEDTQESKTSAPVGAEYEWHRGAVVISAHGEGVITHVSGATCKVKISETKQIYETSASSLSPVSVGPDKFQEVLVVSGNQHRGSKGILMGTDPPDGILRLMPSEEIVILPLACLCKFVPDSEI